MRKLYSLLLICFWILLFSVQNNSASACSVITTVNNDSVWFGYNEDRMLSQFNQITYVRFHNRTSTSYAFMEVTAESTDVFSVRVGINEKGVAISGNAVPMQQIDSQPEKSYTWKTHSLYRLILQKSTNISDVIKIVSNFEFTPNMNYQIHVADSNGDAIVVSPGSNGKIVITQKNDNYFISTNVNRADIENGVDDIRNSEAISLLNKAENLGKETLKSTLKGVHQESYEGCTYYSTIFDLKNGITYFYLMHDYNQEISLNMTHELLQGDHYYLLADLFPNGQQILDQAKSDMQFQESMINLFRVLGLILILTILGHFIFSLYKKIKLKEPIKKRIRQMAVSLGIHGYLIIFLIFSLALIPLILFTNVLTSYLSNSFQNIFLIYIIICLIGLLLLFSWIYYKREIFAQYFNRG